MLSNRVGNKFQLLLQMTMYNDRYHARTIDINMDYTTIRAIELELNQQEKKMFFNQSTCSEKKRKTHTSASNKYINTTK